MNNLVKIGTTVAFALSMSFVNAAGEDDITGERDLFSIFDANNDGFITMAEMGEGMAKMISMDKNGDHMLTVEELQVTEDYNHFMAMFNGIDLNRDGRISMSEIPADMRYKMMKMDKNNDGYISIDELTGEKDVWK